MIIFYVSALIIINYLIFSLYEMEESKHSKIGEFFCEIKDDKKSRFYVTMLLLRRLVFVTLLITITSFSSRSVIGTLIFLQFLYGGYIVFTRPYKDAKGNFIEIMNEIYFTLFLSTFMAFNYENDWTSFKTSVYIWVHVSNFVMVFFIVFVCYIKDLVVWIKSKWEKTTNNGSNPSRIEPISLPTPQTTVSQSRIFKTIRSFGANSTVSSNYTKEESKYAVNESMPEIEIRTKKDWS